MDKPNMYQNTAWLYDYDNRDHLTDDISFYVNYLIKADDEVLELGCGTGRVALKLASEGFSVTGLELSDTMIQAFRSKLQKMNDEVLSNVNLIKGDMASFNLDKKYGLIIAPFRAFQSLTEDEDIKNSIDCIRRHLKENGLFIVNAFQPFKQLNESWCYPETLQWETVDKSTGCKIAKKHWGDKIDTKNQIIYPHYAFEITHPDGRLQRIQDDLKLKYYYYNQLKKYLLDGGLAIVEEYGWYDKSPIENGRELIFVCKKV